VWVTYVSVYAQFIAHCSRKSGASRALSVDLDGPKSATTSPGKRTPSLFEPIVETAMQRITRAILSGFVLTALAAATPAFATTMANFTIHVPGGTVYTFSLPSSFTTTAYNDHSFVVTGVAITITGHGTEAGNTFFANMVGFGVGGLAIYGLNPSSLNLDYEGPVLFTGSLTDPTFKTGTFTLQDAGHPGIAADDATVTILTPEPGTLALFGIGLLCLAGVMRRKLTV